MHNPAQMVDILYWEIDKAEAHAETTHTEHVLAYHVKGIIEMDHGRPLSAGPGMLTILPSGVPHRTLGGRDIGLWRLGFCAMCHNLNEGNALMAPFHRVRMGALPVIPIQKSRQEVLTYLLNALQRESEHTHPETPAAIDALLKLVLVEVVRAMRQYGETPEAVKGSLVADALRFIQGHCLQGISLKDVADAIHRAPTHVATVVKKETGFSVGQWINSGRLAEATRLLVHTDQAMDEIAESVGWRDVTHFIRQFRKAQGVTPAAWRSEHRQRHDPASAAE